MDDVSVEIAADRTAVRDVLERYLFGLDRRDYRGLASCFASDAQAEYLLSASAPPDRLNGVDEIVAFLQQIEAFPVSTHALGNAEIRIDGDRATSDSLVTATLLSGDAVSGRIHVRGIRYADRFLRSTDGWLITHRRHTPVWQYDVVSHPPLLPGLSGS
jgi:hypothetical protein